MKSATQEPTPLDSMMEVAMTDEEEDSSDERTQELQKELSLLKLELVKWKKYVDQFK